MSDESLKRFLKNNVEPVPAEPLGEGRRIWQAINESRQRRFWWRIVPVLTTVGAAVMVFVVHTQLLNREARVEEEYLFQEWQIMMSEVNADESELITTFEK